MSSKKDDFMFRLFNSDYPRITDMQDAKDTLNELFDDIGKYVERCEKIKKEALEKVENWNKDEEIVKLKEEIKRLNKELYGGLGFFISVEEKEKIETWTKQHIKEKHNGHYGAGAIGGRFTYEFTPTSIGEVGEVVCSCGEKFCFRELE